MSSDIVKSRGGVELRINKDIITVDGETALHIDVLSDKKVTLDAKKAESYIDLPIFRGEREVTEAHVQTLFDEMRRGNFNPLLVVLSTAELDGVVYKINGQHTSWAVYYMDSVEPGYSIMVRELRYKVDTPDQLRMLYSTYDRLMGRTDTHVTKVLTVDTPEMSGIPPSVIQRLVPGLKMWLFENNRERSRYKPEQVAALMRQHYSEVFRNVARFYQSHDEMHMRRAPVIAAQFATFYKVAQKAEEFWGPISTGLDLSSKSDPRWRLRDLLMNSSLNAGSSKDRTIDAESLFRCCILSWNKWRAGESIGMALRPTKERTKVR